MTRAAVQSTSWQAWFPHPAPFLTPDLGCGSSTSSTSTSPSTTQTTASPSGCVAARRTAKPSGAAMYPLGDPHRQRHTSAAQTRLEGRSALLGTVLSGKWPPAASFVQYALFGQEQCLLQHSQRHSVQ